MGAGTPIYLEVRDAVCEHCRAHVDVTLPETATHIGEAFAALEQSIDRHLAQCPKAPKGAAAHG